MSSWVYVSVGICGGLLILLTLLIIIFLYCAPKQGMEFVAKYQIWRGKYQEKHYSARNISWAYLERESDQSKETIVFLHGFAAKKESWLTVTSRISHEYQVVLVDLPGHGHTSEEEYFDYSINNQTTQLAAFIESIRGPNAAVHMVGCSMGGLLSGSFAASFPSKVLSLSLVCPAGVSMPNKSAVARTYEDSNGLRNPMFPKTEDEVRAAVPLLFFRPPSFVTPAICRHVIKERRDSADQLNNVFDKVILQGRSHLEECLPDIIAPILVMWGENDQVIDISCLDILHQRSPRPLNVHILPKCGHLIQREHPKICAQAIEHHVYNSRGQTEVVNSV